MAGGDAEYCAILVAINSILQMVLFAPLAVLFIRVISRESGTLDVSYSTVAGLGSGRVVITPQYVTAFAHLLGYQPRDIVALTGVGPIAEDAQKHPASTDIAALAWRARRLSSEQIGDILAAAQTIQHTGTSL